MADSDITSVLHETRIFQPPDDFAARAHLRHTDFESYRAAAAADPQGYWAEAARELAWSRPWDEVLRWNPPFAEWFVGGELNATVSCLDRHLTTWRRNKAAIVWEGEPGDTRTLTYLDLYRETCRFANVLAGLGVGRGDRVVIYMPLVPEAVVAMLACARIGATHSVIFGGFSAQALVDRITDASASLVVTADGGWRRGAVVPLKANVDEALGRTPTVKNVVVLRRTGSEIGWQEGRDHWWHELVAGAAESRAAEALPAEHPLFILYTSGSTGKPKGILHTTGGYMTHVARTARWIFDLRDDDTYWCTADIGWVTGHSYVVYGILANGATSVMYEGAPNWPQPDRFWSIIDRHRVTVFYTAPTAIRAFVKWGDEWPQRHDLGSLRLLGTVGEPINPETWMWYRDVIGKGRCPIVDTWWQTETGGIMISPLPGAVATKPGSATLPFPGIDADVVDREGKSVPPSAGGYLVIRRPWPGMLRTVYGDPERYVKQYWSDIPGFYFSGDGARRDEDGYFWIMGRVDDVLNVAGHRLSTMEIESALVSHAHVAEAAVVGRPDELKGSAIVAFVSLDGGAVASKELAAELKDYVVREIGALARPQEIRFTDALPKTRSGKIMRRLLRQIASGDEAMGDTTTLEDINVLRRLMEQAGDEE